MATRKIYLVDAYNLIYRLFYAVPPFTTRAGQPVNAVFGVAKALLGFANYDKPDLLYFISDAPGKSFREDLYSEYKGTRDRMPDDLKSQMNTVFAVVRSMGIPIIEKSGFEADDIIATLANEFSGDVTNEIFILSGDKDLYQCIGGNVRVYDTMKRKIAGRDETIEKFGVPPERVADYLAITGDSSDNVPGIAGFGPKKAQTLITEFGSLEQIYAALDAGHPNIAGKTADTLQACREIAFLSKKLVLIPTDVELDLPERAACIIRGRNLLTEDAKILFRELEFKSLLGEEETPLGSFGDLGITPIQVISTEELDTLLAQIIQIGKCTIASILTEGSLTGIALQVEDQYYLLDTNKTPLGDFIASLLIADIELVGYDLKDEIKHLQSYQKRTTEVVREGQLGLLF